MEDELSRWIQETVFASYMEECQIFNRLDISYGYDNDFPQECSGNDCPARKRKLDASCEHVDTVSAGKQTRNN